MVRNQQNADSSFKKMIYRAINHVYNFRHIFVPRTICVYVQAVQFPTASASATC